MSGQCVWVEALQPRGPCNHHDQVKSTLPFHQTPPVQGNKHLWAGRTLRDLCVPLSFTDEDNGTQMDMASANKVLGAETSPPSPASRRKETAG